MGRRRFVETVAAAGLGSMATLLTPEAVLAAGRDEVPVVYGHVRGEDGLQPRTTTVPADWFGDLRAALSAHADADLLDGDGIRGAAVVPGEFGGRNAAIEVDATGDADVPEAVGTVPVEVNRVHETGDPPKRDPPADAGRFPKEIPGGVGCSTGDSTGTLAPAMYDGDTAFFATANHVYGGDGDVHRGQPFYLPGNWKIGEVRRGYALDDFVRIDPTDGYRPLSRIHGASPEGVVGQFTRDGLAVLKARGESLEKVAATTGRTAGRIQAVAGLTCAYGHVCKHGQLKWGSAAKFGDGDSGSVNYHSDLERPEEGLLVGGFNNARTWWPGEDYVWGTSAYRITNRHGFTFAPSVSGAP
jgi:hypothetical protein